MKLAWRHVVLFVVGLGVSCWGVFSRPFPAPGDDPVLDLMAFHDPPFYLAVHIWYYAVPGIVTFGSGLLLSGAWRVWFASRSRRIAPRGALPFWPISPTDEAPSLVIGELHHPVKRHEVFNPSWLTLPERGLYTGVAIFGAVGSGKTSACMHPFARQLFSWQAADPQRRASGLLLEVKGDFCHDIRQILIDADRGEDYLEVGLGGVWQWNPLASSLDSYSLAYTIASLLNQLFGKGKDPFWQQAYTNLVRWTIELHRIFPGQWVTLQDIYRCAIGPDLFAAKLKAAQELSRSGRAEFLAIADVDYQRHVAELAEWTWQPAPAGGQVTTAFDAELQDRLAELQIPVEVQSNSGGETDLQKRTQAVARWYHQDWLALDQRLQSSIVEGVSVFLSMFDLPDGTGSGKTTLLNALIELLPEDERIVAIEDTLELRIAHNNCVRFEARELKQDTAVTIRDLVRHALRHRPDHIVVGEVRGAEAADLLQALNTGHGGSLTTVHSNNAESALSRIASCAMQAGAELPWEVVCRNVVDGIAMVIHMTRREGRRFVEEALFIQGYQGNDNR